MAGPHGLTRRSRTSREKLYTSFIRTVSAEPMAESQRNPREVQYGATPLFLADLYRRRAS